MGGDYAHKSATSRVSSYLSYANRKMEYLTIANANSKRAVYSARPSRYGWQSCKRCDKMKTGGYQLGVYSCNVSEEEAKRLTSQARGIGCYGSYVRLHPRVIYGDDQCLDHILKGPTCRKVPTTPFMNYVGFDGFRFEFGDGKDDNPYSILSRKPYQCPGGPVEVEVYYSNETLLKKFKPILQELSGREDIHFTEPVEVPPELDLRFDRRVALLLIERKELRKYLHRYASLKLKSFREGVSRLQLVTDKTIQNLNDDSERHIAANLLTALYFKGGCIPYRIALPNCREWWCEAVRNMVAIGVAIGRAQSGAVKTVAYVTTGLGEVSAYVDTDFKLSGESLEFNDKEIEEFAKRISEIVNKYSKNFDGKRPHSVVVFRTRRFQQREVDSIEERLRKLEASIWRSISNILFGRGGFGRGRDAGVRLYISPWKIKGAQLSKGLLIPVEEEGVVFYKPEGVAYPVALSYRCDGRSGCGKAAVLAYEYTRRLYFESLQLKRYLPAPVSYAKKYLKWLLLASKATANY